jgi:hypothetical protein
MNIIKEINPDPNTIARYGYYDDEKHFIAHREDGPAIESTNGGQWWFQHGHIHRDGDEPAIILPTGFKAWVRNNDYHRDNGPAVEMSNGIKCWYQNGKCHRNDSDRTVEYPDGTYDTWVDGVCMNTAAEDRMQKLREFSIRFNYIYPTSALVVWLVLTILVLLLK